MGDIVSHLWSTVWGWYTSHEALFWIGLAFVAAFSSLFRMSWSAMAGFDSEWDREKFDKDHPNSDWHKATTRRYSWLRLGLFFYVLWLCASLWWFDGFNWDTLNLPVYFTIATLWLLTAPLRNIWLIVTARKVDAKLGYDITESFFEEVSQYYDNAFSRPGKSAAEPWFKGRLQFLNVFQKFRFVFHAISWWGILGVAVEMLMSLAWPFFMGAAVFWYLQEAENYKDHRAWWRYNRKG